VAWALVHLRVKAPALRDPMRNALARQYQATLAASLQQQQGQQQQLLPWSEHAALLLGLARLELPAHTHFARGTSAAICKVSTYVQRTVRHVICDGTGTKRNVPCWCVGCSVPRAAVALCLCDMPCTMTNGGTLSSKHVYYM
jgi:hypothetical protein